MYSIGLEEEYFVFDARSRRAITRADKTFLTNIKKRLGEISQEVFPADQQTPKALLAYHQSEIATWWPIIKAAGIKAQ